MAVLAFDPVGGLLRLQTELDRFFGKSPGEFSLSGPSVYPLVNVFTDGDDLIVRAEVPGIRPDDFRVQVEPGRLTLAGQRAPARTDASFHRRERGLGTFSRTIQLPRDVDPDKAQAEFRNGLLTVRVPRHAAAKPRQVAVRAV